MPLQIMFPRDPPGIVSERETGKLDQCNHSNLLKARYIVSRTIIHNVGGQRQARLSFGKHAPVFFSRTHAITCHYKMNNPKQRTRQDAAASSSGVRSSPDCLDVWAFSQLI